MHKLMIAGIAMLALTACGGSKGLHELRVGSGPDEFLVQPASPLELPADLSVLPTPTPGGTNITDANPVGDAIAALGGRENARRAGGIPAGDTALVTQARRYGVTPNIRAELAEADAKFRKRRTGFLGLFSRDGYFRAYANQALDAYAELTRFRNAGVQTPTAPPN